MNKSNNEESSWHKTLWGRSPVMSEQYGHRWIDLDEYYQSVNGLNSIWGIPEEL